MPNRVLAALSLVSILATPARPQELGDDPRVASALELLDVWVDAERAYTRVPGVSMAVVHDQEVLWARGFGHAHRDAKTPATPETIYSICSISKLFTSIAVMQLRDSGQLELDDPVAEYLSWFDIEQAHPGSPRITLRALLTHSSGLPRESDFPYWTAPEFDFPTRQQVRERLATQETLYPADLYFQYSNLGLTLAGEIVAEVSGQPYPDYVRANILTPLDLEDTSPEIPEAHRGGRLATGYGARERQGDRPELDFFQVRGIAPAAGYASTVLDLAKFASWQFRLLEEGGREVLAANTLREMHRVHWVDPDWDVHWGLGFAVWRDGDETFVGHGGGCPGFRSHLLLQTDDKFAAVVMTNGIDVNSGKYTRTAYKIVAPAIAKALDSPEAGEPADTALAKYTGLYDVAWGGEIAMLTWEGKLAMVYLPSDDPIEDMTELEHIDGHRFRRLRDDGELGEEIVFELDNAGRVVRFKRHSNYTPKIR